MAAGFKDFDDYLNWIGRQEELACTVRSTDESITLRSNGHGGVFIAGAWEGSHGPFTVSDAFGQLADAEVFQSEVDFESAGWGAGDVATLAGLYLADSDYLIDQVEWCGTDPKRPADVEDLVLARSSWELGGGVGYLRSATTRVWWSCCASGRGMSSTSATAARRSVMTGKHPMTRQPCKHSRSATAHPHQRAGRSNEAGGGRRAARTTCGLPAGTGWAGPREPRRPEGRAGRRLGHADRRHSRPYEADQVAHCGFKIFDSDVSRDAQSRVPGHFHITSQE